ncbi:MAG: alpha/beta fold hydrolase [Candidatus Limnocylindrales bacterium]
MAPSTRIRRAGLTAALAAAPFALAWRFAHVYRDRAGYPRPQPPTFTPADLGLPFEGLEIPSAGGLRLPAWWIPSPTGTPGPAVLLVHGWESGRHRTLPNAAFLHAAGFHVLTIDVRGHGANPPEDLPVSAGEFGADALAGARALLAMPVVTAAAILGHSMGSIGAVLAAAAEPRIAALVLTATPADPYRLTRQTFRLARLPIPDPIAYPLAWLTTRVYLQPRGHGVDDISATSAIRRYAGPILLVHGGHDQVVPIAHLDRLARAARGARIRLGEAAAEVEMLTIEGGQHSWLYEFPAYRAAVAGFLARHIGGPLDAGAAAGVAAALDIRRLADDTSRFAALAPAPPLVEA